MSAHSPEETHALIAAALNAGDRDAIADVYEENAVLDRPALEAARQRQGGNSRCDRADASRSAPAPGSRCVEKLETDGLALTIGRWNIVGTDRGERIEMSGRGAIVSRRQPDGSWRVVLDNPMGPF